MLALEFWHYPGLAPGQALGLVLV